MNHSSLIAIASCRDLPAHEHDDRHLVAALEARGLSVVTVPWDDPEFDWARARACLPRTTWDYTTRLDEFREWINATARATRLFNSAELMQSNLDKGYLRDLEVARVPVIPTVWIDAATPVQEPARIMRERGWSRGFLKPAIGAGSELTFRLHDGDDAAGREARDAILERATAMLQPYLAAVESRGEVSAIVIDGEITHAVRKIPVAGDYRVQDDFGAADAATEVTPALRSLAESSLAAAGATGALYARVDALETETGELRLVELELIEPSLFFRHAPAAAESLAAALTARLDAET